VIDLNDRRFADLLVGVVDRVVEQKLRTMLRTHHYGTVVGAPDTVRRTVAVALLGKPEPSPGFVYGEVAPVEGDVVRVVIDPKGDRYVDAVVGREAGFDGDLGDARLRISRTSVLTDAVEVYSEDLSPTTPQLRIGADGLLEWAGDTNLYRLGASNLRTDDDLDVGGNIDAGGDVVAAGLLGASATALSGDTTPTIVGGGTATYTSRNCRWVQIGRLVVFHVGFVVNAAGSGATNVTITGTGLPSAATAFGATGDRGGTGLVRLLYRFTLGGGETQVNEIRNVNAGSIVTGADLASTAAYNVHGAYIAA
jgi:hypothetical protein